MVNLRGESARGFKVHIIAGKCIVYFHGCRQELVGAKASQSLRTQLFSVWLNFPAVFELKKIELFVLHARTL